MGLDPRRPMAWSWNDGPILAYLIGRLALGVNMLVHGAVRLFGDYRGFIKWVTNTFRATPLPPSLVTTAAVLIPIVELIVGALLVFGLLTRLALTMGGGLMVSLIFGMCLVQEWSTVSDQMIYVLTFYLLLHLIRFNRLSLDELWRGKDRGSL